MIRLHVTAEGQTEKAFAEKILCAHLGKFQTIVDARCVLTSKDRRAAKTHRGGLVNYQKAKKDIQNWIREDDHDECRFTTMFDLYALPKDFPGYDAAMRQADPYSRVTQLENALAEDIGDHRFIPYIQLHEFEALIFADPQQLEWEYLEHDKQIGNLIRITKQQKNPELINDGPQTAPSRRILAEIPEYHKNTAGIAVVERIGLKVLRAKCRHFASWLRRLERLDHAA